MRWTLPLLLALTPLAAAPAQAAAAPGDLSVVIMSGDTTNTTSYGASSSDEWRRAKALQRGKQPLLYVRKDGAAYVIRDAAVLARADAIFKPQRDLGARQGALGAEQGRLGSRMAGAPPRDLARLGAQMSELGSRQSALGAEQSRLATRARPQLEALVADALRRGLAQRVD